MRRLINKSKDIETSYEATRAGFLEIALRKNREALPYIDEARAVKTIVDSHSNPSGLIGDLRIKKALIEAAGISTKANNYLQKEDVDKIVLEFIKTYLEPAGENFSEELTYRFLLTKGDALGGRMRNIAGAIANEKLTRFIAAQLRIQNISHSFQLKETSQWVADGHLRLEMLSLVKSIRWRNLNGDRELIYNLTVPVVKKNIDISIFKNNTEILKTPNEKKAFFADPVNYLALGELKGGVDPAGADEHWKTANTALDRIRKSFKVSRHPVHTFFVGSAIEASMAQEIYAQYKKGQLESCANLTNDEQLAELCCWLVLL
jgi:hypothetical protein